MTLFEQKAASLFVLEESSQSQLGLLARDRRPDQGATGNPEEPHERSCFGPKVGPSHAAARSDVLVVAERDAAQENHNKAAKVSKIQEAGNREKDQKDGQVGGSQLTDSSGGNPEWIQLRDPSKLQDCLKSQHQFRAFIIHQQYSHSRLSVTKPLFDSLCSDCRLPVQFQHVLTYFGSRNLEVEVAAPRMRFAHTKLPQPALPAGPQYGFECVYGLRYVELNHRGDPHRPYSLRQIAVCNREDPGLNLSTWVLVAPPPRIVLSLGEHAAKKDINTASNPFQVHLLLFDFAISNWRPYLVRLSEVVQEHGRVVLVATPSDNGPVSLSSCGDLQRLKQLGDEMGDTMVALSTTRHALNRLIKAFRNHVARVPGHGKEAIEQVAKLRYRFEENIRELDWLLQQTGALRQKLLGTSQLVSSLTALGNSQKLQKLGEEAQHENCQIRELTKQSAQDASTVKVLTIIIMVYLPTTVVSNFFSTSFVDNRSEADGPRKLIVLDNWWVFVAVSVPLTVITLYAWWFFQNIQASRMSRWYNKAIAKLRPTFLGKQMVSADEENSMASTDACTRTNLAGEKL